MIQIAALSRTPILTPAAPVPGGDPAAFGISLDALLDMPGQPVAVPGKPLPPSPVAPVSAAPSVLDTDVTPVVTTPATAALVEKTTSEAPASVADKPAAVASANYDGGTISSQPPFLTPEPAGAGETQRPTPVLRAPARQILDAVPRPGDDLQPSQPIEAGEASTFDGKPPLPGASASIAAAPPDEEATEAVDVSPTQFSAKPPRPPQVARTATTVAPDPRAEAKGVPDDDAPESAADPAAAALPTPTLAPISRDAMVVMPTVAPPTPSPAQVDPPVPTSSAPESPVIVVAPQHTSGPPPVASASPSQRPPLTAVSPEFAPSVRPGDAALVSTATAPAPASVRLPESPQQTGEPPQAVAASELADTRVLPANDTIALTVARQTTVAASPVGGGDELADSGTPAAVHPAGGASKDDAVRAQPRVEAAPAVPPVSRAPIAGGSLPTANVTPPLASGANVAASAGPALLAAPASAPSQPMSATPSALAATPAIAPPPSAIAQVSPAPLAPTTAPGPQATSKPPTDSARPDGAPARTLAPVTLVAPVGAQAPVIAAGATAPAFRLFAEAIHAARRDERIGDPLAPAPAMIVDPARAALPVGGGATLDMTDRRWPHAMIDRIEALRDAVGAVADAADTSIRLVPASLGAIDVLVRRDGDTVHVHFAAEQATTRTLLTEAQPRLAELAESRGLKLGQASVGAGSDQQGQRQHTPQPVRIASTPAPANRDEDLDTATTRVA